MTMSPKEIRSGSVFLKPCPVIPTILGRPLWEMTKNLRAHFARFDRAHFETCARGCNSCPVREEARYPVPPIGPNDSEIMIVGRNPGRQEDAYGVPFYPEAPGGRMMMGYLELMGWKREEVYITNALFCHTTKDRTPETPEIAKCSMWKAVELDMLPEVKYIFLFGNDAIRQFMGFNYPSIVRIYHDVYHVYDSHRDRKLMVIPAYHPGYLLRNPRLVREQETFLRQVSELIRLDQAGEMKWLV